MDWVLNGLFIKLFNMYWIECLIGFIFLVGFNVFKLIKDIIIFLVFLEVIL